MCMLAGHPSLTLTLTAKFVIVVQCLLLQQAILSFVTLHPLIDIGDLMPTHQHCMQGQLQGLCFWASTQRCPPVHPYPSQTGLSVLFACDQKGVHPISESLGQHPVCCLG